MNLDLEYEYGLFSYIHISLYNEHVILCRPCRLLACEQRTQNCTRVMTRLRRVPAYAQKEWLAKKYDQRSALLILKLTCQDAKQHFPPWSGAFAAGSSPILRLCAGLAGCRAWQCLLANLAFQIPAL
jgi:hypothetical protein